MLVIISLIFRFVAESTGQQRSSRLLSMKSANALLEVPASSSSVLAGASVVAIVISDISHFPSNRSLQSTDSCSSQSGHRPQEVNACESQNSESRVAILTVSDTVAAGAGPDRRYLDHSDTTFLKFYFSQPLGNKLVPS